MNKSQFLSIAMAVLAITGCGNRNDAQADDSNSVNVAADSNLSDQLPEELKTTLNSLISDFNNSVEENNANALSTTLADMQVIYKNLIDNGKLEEAKAYGLAIQEYLNNHTTELKAMAEGNSNITSLVEGVKNLPVSAEATIEEAKHAVIADVVNHASPAIAKGETVIEKAKETADAVKNAPEAIKNVAEQSATNAVNDAKNAVKSKVDAGATAVKSKVEADKNAAKAKLEAEKAKVEAEKAKAKAAAANKVNEAAGKANSALDKLKSGINAAAQGATR